MMDAKPFLRFLFLMLLAVLAACGGGDVITLVSTPGINYCDRIAATDVQSREGVPDPLINYQWYLDRLSVKRTWDENENLDGSGIQIGVLDDALQLDHEDLRANIAVDQSLNVLRDVGSANVYNPRPLNCDSGHGTAVAGIIAARGDNGLGVKGIAYKASIFGVNYLANSQDQSLRNGLLRDLNRTAISSNSWGGTALTRLRNRLSAATEMALELGLASGFNGKGISYVFAAGNHRRVSYDPSEHDSFPSATRDHPYEDLSTYEELHNHPGIIVVCAVGYDNLSASYSTPGANLWICGASNSGRRTSQLESLGLPTTDLSGDEAGYNARLSAVEDTNCRRTNVSYSSDCFDFGRPYNYSSLPAAGGDTNYHRFFTGTSAATPTVSGVIALLRQANSDLTWRDVKLVLAESAEQIDPSAGIDSMDLGWQSTGGGYHNRSRFYTHHHDYGFGLVDAFAAVALARNWTLVPSARATTMIQGTRAPDSTNTQQTFTFSIADANNAAITFVEYVQVEIKSSYLDFGELTIALASPQGTQSVLTQQHGCLAWSGEVSGANRRNPRAVDRCDDLVDGWTFGTAAHLGENLNGEWELSIRVGGSRDLTGKVDLPHIKAYGHTRRPSS